MVNACRKMGVVIILHVPNSKKCIGLIFTLNKGDEKADKRDDDGDRIREREGRIKTKLLFFPNLKGEVGLD